MNKFPKLLLAMALVVVAIYAGIKTYIYYQARGAMQQLVTLAGPFAKIEYQGISSSLWSGTVEVEGIKVTPTGIGDSVGIGAFAFSAGDLRRLFRVMREAQDRTPPDTAHVALRAVRFDLNGELIGMADSFINAAAASNPATVVSAPHCGNQSMADFAFLRRLGYEALVLDLELHYSFNSTAELLKLGIDFRMHDMTRLSTDIKVGGVQDLTNFASKPQVREVGIVIEDLSYNERLKSYCVKTAKISEADYLKAETGPDSMFYRQLGITPGPGLQEAYRQFLTKTGAAIEVRARPIEGFDPNSMLLYKPADLVGMLNLGVNVNGKPVNDISFNFGVLERPQVADATTPSKTPAPPALRQPVRANPSAPTPERSNEPVGLRPVRVAELDRYLGRYVRLHERSQAVREGKLLQISGGAAVLEREYGTGNVVVKVPLARIERAEVEF